MVRSGLKLVMLLLVTLGIVSCATQRPVLYPNERLKEVGSNTAEKDIDDCIRKAEQYASSSGPEADIAERAAIGVGTDAAVGAAGGAAGGAVVGQAGHGAAVGAAAGSAAGFTRWLLAGLFASRGPGPAYRSFVNRCLREKGYEAVDWK